MKNPTKAQVQIVIDNLTKMLPYAKSEENLDMLQSGVPNKISLCGTTCCHGGWYAASKLIDTKTGRLETDENSHVDYLDGANMMAKDLGLIDVESTTCSGENALQLWSREYPDIWWGPDVKEEEIDNIYSKREGAYHFSSSNAFYHPKKRPEGAKKLKDIIDHWKEVKKRLPE